MSKEPVAARAGGGSTIANAVGGLAALRDLQRGIGNRAITRVLGNADVAAALRSPGRPLSPPVRESFERLLAPRVSQGPHVAPRHAPPFLATSSREDRHEQEARQVSAAVLAPAARARPAPPPLDLSRVRIHDDPAAARSARALNALAYTVGSDIVFAAGRYSPTTAQGRQLLAHELTHVVQQSRLAEPMLQPFTAELDGAAVYLRPEPGDKDADLDRVLCPGAGDRKLSGRERIDVTNCLPPSVVRALTAGPYNCSQFVRFSMTDEGAALDKDDVNALFTVRLWNDLLRSGYRLSSIAFVEDDGTVTQASRKDVHWKQSAPRMGEPVFMVGGIRLNKAGTKPNREGDNFTVSWDHVGIFIVRSRGGHDFHLAKDGDENPIGVYRTGTAPAEGAPSGAYVRGLKTLVAYLRRMPVGMGDVKLAEERLERESRAAKRPVGMGDVKKAEWEHEHPEARPK